MSDLWRTPSPYERYLETLRDARLDETALGRDWEMAGQQVLAQPLAAELPFRETAYFAPDTPAATAYRMDLPRGRRFVVDITFDSTSPAALFVDLFKLTTQAVPTLLASLEPGQTTMTHDVEEDGSYLLRIQPELLRGGRYTVVERTQASLAFPVAGIEGRKMQSLFGAERDAGARAHEGVDIFAARGTAAIAVADGLARSSTNSLGGNVVWLHDAGMGLTYYYAHLDRWEREGVARVRVGDVVGYVGNTGNARTTAPHLHFGIYDRGAIDPVPFLAPDDGVPDPSTAPRERFGEWVRVVLARTPLREGSHRAAAPIRNLDRGWLGRVVGVSRQSFRVTLPDNSTGYVTAAAMTTTEEPLSRGRLQPGDVVRERPLPTAPAVDTVESAVQAEILGRFESFDLVRLPSTRGGWVQRSEAGLGRVR